MRLLWWRKRSQANRDQADVGLKVQELQTGRKDILPKYSMPGPQCGRNDPE